MIIDIEPGYYVTGYGRGGYHGPKASELSEKWRAKMDGSGCPIYGASSLRVDLLYGTPVVGEFQPFTVVRPIERAYELLRYHDPEEQDFIYITRHDPSHIIWGRDDHGVAIPNSPQLNRVFEELLPLWEREQKLSIRRDKRAFSIGMQRLDVTWANAPVQPGEGASKKDLNRWERQYVRFN